MFLKKFFTKPLMEVLVLVLLVGIFIFTFYITIWALGPTTIYCDSDLDTLANNLVNFIRSDENLSDHFMVTLSNLELLQPSVGVPINCYDIDCDQPNVFFGLFLQSQDLSVEIVNGVYLDVFRVNNNTYTVHPFYIEFILSLFRDILY